MVGIAPTHHLEYSRKSMLAFRAVVKDNAEVRGGLSIEVGSLVSKDMLDAHKVGAINVFGHQPGVNLASQVISDGFADRRSDFVLPEIMVHEPGPCH
jgi:hypothetical protein